MDRNHFLRLFLLAVLSGSMVACLAIRGQAQGVPDDMSQDLKNLWAAQQRILHDSRVDIMAVESAKKSIIDYLLNQGIQRSEILASVYCFEGVALLEKGNWDSSVWAFRTALEMDPSFIPAARGLIRATMKKGIISGLLQVDVLLKAYIKSFYDAWFSLRFIGNISLYYIRMILIAFFSVTSILTIKNFGLWIHEIQEKFPGFISEKWLAAALIIILLIPFLLGFGLVWTAVMWSMLVYLYLSKKETTVIWIIVLMLFLIIPANVLRTSILKGYNDSILPAMAKAEWGGYSQGIVDSIKSYQLKNAQDARARFIAGLVYKKGGRYFESLKEYLEYTRMVPDDPKGHVNLGNVYFILNNMTEAISEYRKAESMDASNATIYYNLSKAYLHQFRFQQASEMLKKASAIDASLVNYYTDIHSTNPNRLLADSEFPSTWIWQEVYSLLLSAFAEQDTYWISLGPGLNLMGTAVVLSGFVLMLAILQAVKSRLKMSYYCVMCGQASCTSCQKDPDAYRYCSNCYMLFIKKSQLEAKARDQFQESISRRQYNKWRISVILSLIFPGSGEMFFKTGFRGLIFVCVWSFALSSLISGTQRFNMIWNFPQISATFEITAWIALLAIVYLVSFIFIYQRRYE